MWWSMPQQYWCHLHKSSTPWNPTTGRQIDQSSCHFSYHFSPTGCENISCSLLHSPLSLLHRSLSTLLFSQLTACKCKLWADSIVMRIIQIHLSILTAVSFQFSLLKTENFHWKSKHLWGMLVGFLMQGLFKWWVNIWSTCPTRMSCGCWILMEWVFDNDNLSSFLLTSAKLGHLYRHASARLSLCDINSILTEAKWLWISHRWMAKHNKPISTNKWTVLPPFPNLVTFYWHIYAT